MKIAVIGATGKVGGHVVKLALGQGTDVVAVARQPSRISQLGGTGKMDAFTVDLMSDDAEEKLAVALNDVEFVVSCLGTKVRASSRARPWPRSSSTAREERPRHDGPAPARSAARRPWSRRARRRSWLR